METTLEAVEDKDGRLTKFLKNLNYKVSKNFFMKFLREKKHLLFTLACLLLSLAPVAAASLFIDVFYQPDTPSSQAFEGEWGNPPALVYTPPTSLVFAAAAAGPALYWTGWAVFLFVGGMLLGGRSSFREMFKAAVTAWAPFAVRAFLQSLYIAFTRTPVVNPGLSGFGLEALPGEWAASFLNHILAHTDIYLPFHLVLLVHVGGRAAGLSTKNAVKLVLAGVLLVAVLTYLPGLVSDVIADWASNSSF